MEQVRLFEFLKNRLNQKREENSLRVLQCNEGMVDFCSNDYLGFAGLLLPKLSNDYCKSGSTGSRLLSGNSLLCEQVELQIAAFHKSASSLIFNSGYDANVGFFSSLPQRHDTILYDSLVHASIRDGIRLSLAKSYSFRHNDLNHLEDRLKKSEGNVFVAVESIYSMDGDECPLVELIELVQKYNAYVVLDEAHATGVIGQNGEGLAQSLGLQDAVFARIHTFGKALGVHGAAVVGSKLLTDYLLNFARSFIYTTAMPPHSFLLIAEAYSKLPEAKLERKKLTERIDYFRKCAQGKEFLFLDSLSPIQGIVLGDKEKCKKLSGIFKQEFLDARAILTPTVPEGKERIRICLHSYNTLNEIDLIFESLDKYSECL